MNIIDAIKSGKKFRRKGQEYWKSSFTETEMLYKYYSAADVLADDWEVEDKKITITESEFDGIVEHILAEWEYSKPKSPHQVLITALSGLKKELGL